MNRSGSNTSRRQSNDHTRRIFFFISLAIIITVLVVIAIVTSNNTNGSSTEGTDVGSANNDLPSSKTPEPSPATASGTIITTGDSEFGTMLFNEKKQAIYIWEREGSEKPECYADCAEAWPPVLTDGEPQAGGDVNSGLLGITTRTDGSTQVTYNGHPLYYYAHEAPGEVKCHNISTHGGLWWVIQPGGNRAD